ncbi:hypothetical protein GGI20_001442 [Coemansia sp. BCRC 34301]|nr:hypothetical protein GGI20_001442 [Coemansia sp. BCRC 34301]
MLSAEPATESAEEVVVSFDAPSWLPEFDSPGVTIALPTLTAYETSQSLDACLLHPSLAKPNDDHGDADSMRPQELLAVNPVPHSAMPVVGVAESACPDVPPVITTTTTTLLDHLGLSFDFHSDPALDAIADSPLYLALASRDIVITDDTSDDALVVEHEPTAVHLPGLPESPLNSASLASPLSLETSESAVSSKSRTRRASIVGLLKNRLSKCADVNGHISTDSNVVVVGSGDDVVVALDVLPVEPEPSHITADAKVDPDATCDPQDVACEQLLTGDVVCEEPIAVEPAAPEPAAIFEVPQKEKEEESPTPAVSLPANEHGVEHESPAAAAEPPAQPQTQTQASSDMPPLGNTETTVQEPAPETPLQHNNDDAVDATDSQLLLLPAPPRRPPMYHRHLDRRSSRILDGITRKVQHVRQTTSMVLRRSVGSRLSVRPTTPNDVFQGSVVGLAGLRGCGLDDAEPDRSQNQARPPPQYSVSDGEPASLKADDSTSAVCSGRSADANSTSANAPSSHAADHINELGEKLVDVPAARSTTAVNTSDDHTLNATSDKFNVNSISRKLVSVRHGTNTVVRNSVTRVKNIFAAKRSVAA